MIVTKNHISLSPFRPAPKTFLGHMLMSQQKCPAGAICLHVIAISESLLFSLCALQAQLMARTPKWPFLLLRRVKR